MNSFEIKDIVASFVGQANTIATPAIFKKWLSSYNTAVLLSQIIYWGDRTDDKDGWFYKSYAEWEAEIYLTERETRYAVENLEKLDLIETKLAKINGSPVKHYRLKSDVFEQKFLDFLAKEREKQKSEQSPQVVENKVTDGILQNVRMETDKTSDSLSSQKLLTKSLNTPTPRTREPESTTTDGQSTVQTLGEMPDEPSEKLRFFPFLERTPLPIETLNELADLFSFIASKEGRNTLYSEQEWIELCRKLFDEGMSVEGIKCLYRYCDEILKMNPITAKVMNWKFTAYKKFVEGQQKPKPKTEPFNPLCFKIESNPLPEGYA